MHRYDFHIGDYYAAAGLLDPMADLAYRRMMDRYYLNEKPLPREIAQVARMIGYRSPEQIEAVRVVLHLYFTEQDDGWHQKRIDEEIAAYRGRVATARRNGTKGGNPKKKAGYNEPGMLYVAHSAARAACKVGITKYLASRLSQLKKKVPDVALITSIEVSDMGAAEAFTHAQFADRMTGEWVLLGSLEPTAFGAEVCAKLADYCVPSRHATARRRPRSTVTNLPPSATTQDHSVAKATGAAAPPEDPDPVFGVALQFLLRKGIKEANARSYLGLMRKKHGDALVIEVATKAEQEDVSEPLGWMRKAMEARSSGSAHKPAKLERALNSIRRTHDALRGNQQGDADDARALPAGRAGG